jgi:hypothetical protein
VINDAEAANAAYLLLGSASGTSPGFSIGPHHIPLNADTLFLRTLERAGQGVFVESIGRLDGGGRAQADLRFPAGALGWQWVGRRFDWAAIYFGGQLVGAPGTALRIAGPAGFDVVHR